MANPFKQAYDNLTGRSARYKDLEVNSFVKTNLRYTDNPLLKFQDPTYLGFKLFFLFDQPESGLLSTIAHPNTALHYLESRGMTQRANYLKSFVDLLKRINSECPWFWQSIEGLDEAWKHGFGDEFKAGLSKDRKISINTLDESIDLRMTALIDLYRKACFDWPNRREIVPRNLRYFTVAIYAYEARSINRDVALNLSAGIESALSSGIGSPNVLESLTKGYKQIQELLGDEAVGENDPITNQVNTINDNISRIMMDFSYCEFDPDESGVVLSSLSHKELGLRAQKIVFSYRNVAEHNMFRMFSDSPVSDIIYSKLDNLALDSPSSIILDKISNKISKVQKGFLNKLLLGNAYGFSVGNIANAFEANPAAIIGQAKNLGGSPSEKNTSKGVSGSISEGASVSNRTTSIDNKPSIIDNTEPSLTSGASFPPNGNPYPGSKSIINGNDVNPSGNAYK